MDFSLTLSLSFTAAIKVNILQFYCRREIFISNTVEAPVLENELKIFLFFN